MGKSMQEKTGNEITTADPHNYLSRSISLIKYQIIFLFHDMERLVYVVKCFFCVQLYKDIVFMN